MILFGKRRKKGFKTISIVPIQWNSKTTPKQVSRFFKVMKEIEKTKKNLLVLLSNDIWSNHKAFKYALRGEGWNKNSRRS